MSEDIEMMTKRWAPWPGFHDIAENACAHLWEGTEHRNQCCYHAAHSMPSMTMLWGLARHASIGRPKPKFVEIGVQKGHSTRALLLAAHEMDGHVYSMDIDPSCGEGDLKKWVEERNLQDRWTFTAGSSHLCPPVPDTDFLLVDGNHDYEAVCADMATHGTAVREGGVIILDDYYIGFPGKQRWIQERWRELQPLTVGPFAILRPQAGDAAIYSREYKEGTWEWDL